MRRMIIAAGIPLLILALLYSVLARSLGAIPTAAPVAAPVLVPEKHTPAGGPSADTYAPVPGVTAAAASVVGADAGLSMESTTGSAVARSAAPVPPAAGGAGAAPMAPVAGDAGTLHYGGTYPDTAQSPLTAGQVDDNAKFSDYLDYIHQYQGPTVHPIAVDQRLFVRVVDGQQHPVAGARVQLFDGNRAVFDGRTVSDGRVLFFPQAVDATQASTFRAVISRGQTQVTANVAAGQAETTVNLDKLTGNDGPVSLDLVFLLDATGSMGDEIAQIKATVDSISSRIEQLPGSSTPRFGLVAFRDRGDDFVTHSWDFTGDVAQFQANLANVQAGGGGDDPESVSAGLHDAIHLPGWAPQDSGRHLRMIVLVGDAPPHLDYPNDYEYTTLLQEAVAAGIKIFPIGASGLPDQGEYIFRQFAEVTQGQFVFMTYANGVSGAPGAATDHHVSDFTVSNLDNLVVRLVAGEIGNQTGTTIPDAALAPVPVPVPLNEPDVPPVPMPESNGVLDLLGGLAQGANAMLTSASAPLWLLLLLVVLLWAGRGEMRARRAGTPALAFVGPDGVPSPAANPPARAAARVSSEPTTILPAAETRVAAAPVAATLYYTPSGAATAPLPALPDEVRRAAR
jgi:hypothetical protein